MRVVVPFTHKHSHPEVMRAFGGTGYRPERCHVDGDTGYWVLLEWLWSRKATFGVVEHDVVVRPDTPAELEECESDWCAFQVPYVGVHWAGLSCAKFSGDLIARQPDALHEIAKRSDAGHPPKHWCRLDAFLQDYLTAHGETKCVHGPPLEHLRDTEGRVMPSHDCWR